MTSPSRRPEVKRILRRAPLQTLVIVLCLMVAACTSYQVLRPERTFSKIEEASSPMPLAVGFAVVKEDLSGGFRDVGSKLAVRVITSGLFRQVTYPLQPSDDVDIEMSASIKAGVEVDSLQKTKDVVVGLVTHPQYPVNPFHVFAPVVLPLLRYTHHYKVTVEVLVSRSGQSLKTYTAASDITLKHGSHAPREDMERDALRAAIEDAVDNFLWQLSQDRTDLVGLISVGATLQ